MRMRMRRKEGGRVGRNKHGIMIIFLFLSDG